MITAVLFALLPAYELRAGVTPVQKVIQLLTDMHAKGDTERKDEAVAFTSLKQWCDDTTEQKQKAITEGEQLMEQLQAEIQKADSDVAQLNDEIAEIDAQIDAHQADIKATQEIRAKEKSDYQAAHADYSESIDAVARAVNVLGKQNFDRGQASSLLQKVSSLQRVPNSARTVLDAFLSTSEWEEGDGGMSVSAPQANAYEFQSGGVIDMLKKLGDKFHDERSELEKEEMEKKHAANMLIQDRTDQVERAEGEKGRKKRTRGQRQEDGASARGELADTTATRDADQKYLDEMVAGCTQKSQDFEARQQLRAEELEAIEKAVEILGSNAVSGNADKHLPALVQRSLGLLRSSTRLPIQKQVSAFLQGRADKIHSKTLALIASKVREDPFEKVKKMIKDMVVRLMEEANEETEHKGWCDTELATNKVQRDSKTEQVNTLTAQVDQLSADIAKLGQEIAELTQQMADSDAAVRKATEIRTAEKAKNEETVADSKEAQEAVAQALSVLKEFYAKAAEATALVQQPNAMDDAPDTFNAPFQGQQAESGGVVGMLEVIASDFARLESDTSSGEAQAAREYKDFSNSSEIDRATKSTDVKNKGNLKTRKEGELTQAHKDLKGTQEELNAALTYYDKLKPSCVNAGVDYDERVARREAEIQSLKEALQILSGEDV